MEQKRPLDNIHFQGPNDQNRGTKANLTDQKGTNAILVNYASIVPPVWSSVVGDKHSQICWSNQEFPRRRSIAFNSPAPAESYSGWNCFTKVHCEPGKAPAATKGGL